MAGFITNPVILLQFISRFELKLVLIQWPWLLQDQLSLLNRAEVGPDSTVTPV